MDGSTESKVKMVKAMYGNTTGGVVVGSGIPNEFQINIGLRQGSALSPLFIVNTIILYKSVCRRSQTAGRNSCSIVSRDVSN